MFELREEYNENVSETRKKLSPWRVTLVVIASVLIVLLGVVAAIVLPIVLHTNAGSSGQMVSEEFVSTASATGEDGLTRTLTVTDVAGRPADLSQITPGQELIVSGTGYDPMVGIYVSICKIAEDPTIKPGPCLGGVPEGATEGEAAGDTAPMSSAWVTDSWAWRGFATHQYTDPATGSFEVRLLVPAPTQQGLDCLTELCGITTRADHTAVNDRVQDIQLRVAYTEQP